MRPGPTQPDRARRNAHVAITMATALGACLATASRVRADRLYLSDGGMIEGKVIADEQGVLRVAMIAGALELPSGLVTRRVRERSRFEEYEALRDAQPLDAASHTALARWCRDHGFATAQRDHAMAAVRLDPMDGEARSLAGYVRLSDLWLSVADPSAASPRAEDVRLMERIVAGWRQRVRALRESYLEARLETATRNSDMGRSQLLAIRSPLAVAPAVAALTDAQPRTRILLADLLGQIECDAARLNLLAMTLLDEDGTVREAASLALRRADDGRAVGALRAALRCRTDDVVRRAATALGQQADMAAFDDLVSALSTTAFAQERLSLSEVLTGAAQAYAEPYSVPLDDRLIAWPSKVACPDWARRVDRIETDAEPPASKFRSQAQEALIELTGQNFGFDETAWRAWRAETRSSGTPNAADSKRGERKR